MRKLLGVVCVALLSPVAFCLQVTYNYAQGTAPSACVLSSTKQVFVYGISADMMDSTETLEATLQLENTSTQAVLFQRYMGVNNTGNFADHIDMTFPPNYDANNLVLGFTGAMSDPDSTSGNSSITLNGSNGVSHGYIAIPINNQVCVQFNGSTTHAYENVVMFYSLH